MHYTFDMDDFSIIFYGLVIMIFGIIASLFLLWAANKLFGQQGMIGVILLIIVIGIGLITFTKKSD